MALSLTNGLFEQNDVRETATADISSIALAPIGAVIAWLKSYTNTPQTLPTGWVECDGATLSDADSVYDGQVLPDLNGDNRFLRGNSTSGGTGGSETHLHQIQFNTTSQSGSGVVSPTANPQPTDSASTLPTYYEVVWIMRVK